MRARPERAADQQGGGEPRRRRSRPLVACAHDAHRHHPPRPTVGAEAHYTMVSGQAAPRRGRGARSRGSAPR